MRGAADQEPPNAGPRSPRARVGARPGQRKQVGWKRDPAVLARLPIVERLHLDAVPNVAIAARLGVDEATIRRDLSRLNQLWMERVGDEVITLRAQALARLDHIYYLALRSARIDEAFERAVLVDDPVPDRDPSDLDLANLPGAGAVNDAGEVPALPGATTGGKRVVRDKLGRATFRGNRAGALSVALQAVMAQAKLLGLLDRSSAPAPTGSTRVTVREVVLERPLDLAQLMQAAQSHEAPDAGHG